jgi:hypothetical protein
MIWFCGPWFAIQARPGQEEAKGCRRLENPRKANPTVNTLERIARVYGKELSIQIG